MGLFGLLYGLLQAGLASSYTSGLLQARRIEKDGQLLDCQYGCLRHFNFICKSSALRNANIKNFLDKTRRWPCRIQHLFS